MAKRKKHTKSKQKRLITYNTSFGGKYPYPLNLNGVKTQALLVFACETLKSALDIDQKELSNDSNLKLSIDQEKTRDQFLNNLYDSLKKVVPSYKELQTLLQLANKNQSMFIAAKQHSPLSHYFNVIATKYDTLINEGETWIPELLGLSLIYQWINEKEKNLSNSYSFITELNLESMMDLYRSAYLKEKKEGRVESISKMLNIADILVEELDSSKFPIEYLEVV